MLRKLFGRLAVAGCLVLGCSADDSKLEDLIATDDSDIAEASDIAEQVDNQAVPNEGIADEEEEAVLGGEGMFLDQDMEEEMAEYDNEPESTAISQPKPQAKFATTPKPRSAQKPTIDRGGETMYVKTYALNARSGPGTENPVIGHYAFGKTVRVIAVQGTWAKDSNGAYVLYKYLSKTKPKKPIILWHLIKKDKED